MKGHGELPLPHILPFATVTSHLCTTTLHKASPYRGNSSLQPLSIACCYKQANVLCITPVYKYFSPRLLISLSLSHVL